MRVGIQTWGSEGDVRPFFSLAQALVARGHQVRLAYTNVEGRDFGALAADCGIDAVSVAGDYFRENKDAIDAAVSAAIRNESPLGQVRKIFEHLMDPVVDRMVDASMDLARDCDVVVGHFMTHMAATAAMKHERPFVVVTMQPVIPSKHYAPIGLPELGRLLNPLLWKIMGAVIESVLAERVNVVRRRFELPERRGLQKHAIDDCVLGLIAMSPSLFARPVDWDPRVQLCGFLGVPSGAEKWEPSPELRAFLDAGPPVFLSFGSMFNLDPRETLDAVNLFVEALAIAGARGIIQAPAGIIAQARKGDHVRYVERAPHAQLFARCSVVVHHGGAGTTQTALLAGKPSIVVPHITDQFYFGKLLHARGVASAPLDRKRLAAKPLAARIQGVLADEEMTARAKALATSLASENGPLRAAELIEEAMRAKG
ncbi:MAG: glycosyltransferase [Polyangiales bacterium]